MEPPQLKISKSKSRYDNQVLSSGEKAENLEESKYKTNTTHNSKKNLNNYTEIGPKKSSDDPEVIKSLAKDNYNPFLMNALEHAKHKDHMQEK